MFTLKHKSFSAEELLSFARSLGEILHWDFGPIMEMRFDRNASNYLFSDGAVPFHWDGAFYKEPRFLLFYCTESLGTGGETLFTNTEHIYESLSAEEKDLCHRVVLTYRTEKKAHYGGEITLPLVGAHPISGKPILRLAERVETELNPVTLEIKGIEDTEAFYQKMVRKLYQPEFLRSHEWEKGDLLLCDNFTYLHGRRALGNNLKRSFKRIQIL